MSIDKSTSPETNINKTFIDNNEAVIKCKEKNDANGKEKLDNCKDDLLKAKDNEEYHKALSTGNCMIALKHDECLP